MNIKVNRHIKAKAQEVAEELGFNLSSLVNAYLRQLIKTKTVNFSTVDEEPTENLLEMLEQSKNDKSKKKVSPVFSDAKRAVAWLNK